MHLIVKMAVIYATNRFLILLLTINFLFLWTISDSEVASPATIGQKYACTIKVGVKWPSCPTRLRGGGRKRNFDGEITGGDGEERNEGEEGETQRASEDVMRQRRIVRTRRDRRDDESAAVKSQPPSFGRFFQMDDILADTDAQLRGDTQSAADSPTKRPTTVPAASTPDSSQPPIRQSDSPIAAVAALSAAAAAFSAAAANATGWQSGPETALEGLDWSAGGLGGVPGAKELHDAVAEPLAAVQDGYRAWVQYYALQARVAREALHRLRAAADAFPRPPAGVEAALTDLAGPGGLLDSAAAAGEQIAAERRAVEEEAREQRAVLQYLQQHYDPGRLAWPPPKRTPAAAQLPPGGPISGTRNGEVLREDGRTGEKVGIYRL